MKRWGYQAFSEQGTKTWHVDAEKDLGRAFAAASVYMQLDSASDFPSEGRHILDVGGLIYLNINNVYLDTDKKKTGYTYDSIVDGSHDPALDEWAVALQTLPRWQVIVGFQHEPTVNNPLQPKAGDWSGPAYVAAYRYVHDYLTAKGVQHRWGFYPVVANFTGHSHKGVKTPPFADDYYPGDDIIDVMGADIYNHSDSQSDMPKKVQAFLDYAAAHDKLVGVGELGDTDSVDRPARIAAVAKQLADSGKLVHVCWNAKPEYGLKPGSAEWKAWLDAGLHGGFQFC